MAVSVSWGPFQGVYRARLKGFVVDPRQVFSRSF